ncbi:60Kd inner membrane protein-domain-containing protein [Microdochium bolleyi]|uniref:60Kd inner membrane protein-domain-containing protein n=1 Tax=Microdochium bolleyi TaxID=196109 RepID=A0A136J8R8_9PEZI|nr:60Kd inner membrane protein-domain-containing protein [Microdochium bolleyi]
MLPSRGLARTSPASVLRSRLSPTCSASSSRHFSALTRTSSASSRRGVPSLYTHLASSSSPLRSSLGAAPVPVSVFATRNGATRNLSLWGWGWSSKKPADPSTTATTATTTPAASPEPAVTESMIEPTKAAAPAPPAETLSSAPAEPALVDPASLSDPLAFWELPEHIGYLKELGLDYGRGPTACCEWLLEHIYIYTGMPWWASIAATALAFRVAMFWPTVVSTRHSALLQKAHKSPEYITAYAEMQTAMHQSKDNAAMMQARQAMKEVTKASGAKFRWIAVPFLTVPFSYGMFRLMRGMAAVPVPSLENGGFLWFTDLTIADPYYILPLANAALGVAMFKSTQKNNVNQTPMAASMGQMMTYVLPPLVFMTTAWLPAAVQWFFLILTASTTAQSTITLNPAFRRLANLTPLAPRLPPVTTTGAASAQWQAPNAAAAAPQTTAAKQGFRDSIRNNMKEMRTNINNAVGQDEKTTAMKKAREYEERRAAEEQQRAERRIEDMRRRHAEKRRR